MDPARVDGDDFRLLFLQNLDGPGLHHPVIGIIGAAKRHQVLLIQDIVVGKLVRHIYKFQIRAELICQLVQVHQLFLLILCNINISQTFDSRLLHRGIHVFI